MVVHRYGDGSNRGNELREYVGPTEIIHRQTHVYLYDSGTGVMIAELSEEAAATVRDGGTLTLTSDGHGAVTVTKD